MTTGPIQRTIRLAGQTNARNFRTIVAPILRGPESRGNLIILKMVPNGARVKKGDTVVEIDAQSVVDHIDDVQDTVNAAKGDVEKRRAEQQVEWETLQQTLRVAQAEYDKAKLDYQPAEVKTDIEKQLLKLSLDEAEARLAQAKKDIDFKKASQSAEIRILQLTYERQLRHLRRHEGDLKTFTIKAPMSGLAVMATIFRGGDITQLKEGDQIFPGQQLMKVVDPNTMQVEASINQAESGLFKLNQKALVSLDAFGSVKVDGRVRALGALASRSWREQYYIRSIPIQIALQNQDERIIPDLSASVAVVLGEMANATVMPRSGIVQEGDKTYAMVKTANGAFEKRPVQLGLASDTQVAVLSGVQPGDEVRLN